MNTHCIKKVTLEVSFSHEISEFNFDTAKEYYYSCFEKITEECFTSYNRYSTTCKIEEIAVELPPILFPINYTILAENYRIALNKALSHLTPLFFSANSSQLKNATSIDTDQLDSLLELVTYFMLNGSYPWWVKKKDKSIHEAILRLFTLNPTSLCSVLLLAHRTNASALRILTHIPIFIQKDILFKNFSYSISLYDRLIHCCSIIFSTQIRGSFTTIVLSYFICHMVPLELKQMDNKISHLSFIRYSFDYFERKGLTNVIKNYSSVEKRWIEKNLPYFKQYLTTVTDTIGAKTSELLSDFYFSAVFLTFIKSNIYDSTTSFNSFNKEEYLSKNVVQRSINSSVIPLKVMDENELYHLLDVCLVPMSSSTTILKTVSQLEFFIPYDRFTSILKAYIRLLNTTSKLKLYFVIRCYSTSKKFKKELRLLYSPLLLQELITKVSQLERTELYKFIETLSSFEQVELNVTLLKLSLKEEYELFHQNGLSSFTRLPDRNTKMDKIITSKKIVYSTQSIQSKESEILTLADMYDPLNSVLKKQLNFLINTYFKEYPFRKNAVFMTSLTEKLVNKSTIESENYSELLDVFPNELKSEIVRNDTIQFDDYEKAREWKETETRYIENSGLILVYPYFTSLFSRCELLDKGKFKSTSALFRAFSLLHYTVYGISLKDESDTLLSKVLLGYPLSEFVSIPPELSLLEKEHCDSMLEAVITHWSSLKKTSIQNLRSSFLQRNGRIEFKQNCWDLTVESAAFDMLLEKLPWTIGTIRLSWMDFPIYVNWKTQL